MCMVLLVNQPATYFPALGVCKPDGTNPLLHNSTNDHISDITKGGPGRAQAWSNTLLKQSTDQIVPYQLTKSSYVTDCALTSVYIYTCDTELSSYSSVKRSAAEEQKSIKAGRLVEIFQEQMNHPVCFHCW